MTTGWTQQDLAKIAATDDLHVAPFRPDGKTYGTPTWIWSVVMDGDLYVRPYNGNESSCIRRRCARRRGASPLPG